jgi:hypothetical protein
LANPCVIAAAAVTTLKVEPGGYWAWITRSIRGWAGLFWNCAAYWALVMPSANWVGSYVGDDAMAMIWPLLGSITTTPPAGAT